MHYYKRNIGDYAKKAGRLSMLQHGSYTLLIDACYDREHFPTLEEAIEWTWASTDEEIAAVTFVLGRFFTLEDGVYVQHRIKEEIAEYHGKVETNKRIAIERETKRRENSTNRAQVVHGSSRSDNEPPPNQEPRTKNQEPINPNAASPDGFAEFWSAYPKKVGKGDAEKAWRKAQPLLANKMPDVLAAIRAAAATDQWRKDGGQYIPNPATWLNQRRWEDGGTVESGWWAAIGFSAEWEAINAGATQKNAHLWRDGRPTRKLAGVELPMWGES